MIYTRFSFWNEQVAHRSFWNDANYYLWVARYPEPQPNLNEESPWWDGKYMPRADEWTDWNFWQVTEEMPGKEWGVGSSFIDLDFFHGDQNDFNEFIGVITVDIPKYVYVSKYSGCNLVNVKTGLLVGLVPKGTQFVVSDYYKSPSGEIWYKVGTNIFVYSKNVTPLIV